MAPKRDESQERLRKRQLAQIEEAMPKLETRIVETERKQKRVALLDSVSLGLYEEIDKLSRKSPGEPLTELAVSQANDLIGETKELLSDDAYIQRLNQFVPAGDNPQHRDAVVVLRQIRQGLERAYQDLDALLKVLKSRVTEARVAGVALELALEDLEATDRNLLANGVVLSNDWMTYGAGSSRVFSFGRLDRTDICEYFSEGK